MLLRDARIVASEWVVRHAKRTKDYIGAYFCGSTIELADSSELSPYSDVDIVVVVDAPDALPKLGKFVYRGVLIEVTYLLSRQLESPWEVLASHHLANSFKLDTIIDDPTGHLHRLQSEVAHHFAEWKWVNMRCEGVLESIERRLSSLEGSMPLHDRVLGWLFPTGITTHVLLLAALKNPTVRLRYLAVRSVLAVYGHMNIYDRLLELLQSDLFDEQRAKAHCRELAKAYDAALRVAKTPFPFSSDISTASRHIAIDGSFELIERGDHREAVFWMLATFARCHKVLYTDAPREVWGIYVPAFRAMLADTGIDIDADVDGRAVDVGRAGTASRFADRAQAVIEFLPKLREVSRAIMLANPHIFDKPHSCTK